MESGRCTRDVMGAPHLGNRERDGHSVLGLEGGQELAEGKGEWYSN